MKHAVVITTLLLLANAGAGLSQNWEEGYIYVDVKDSAALPIGTGIYTRDPALNQLFDMYKVVQYRLSWPKSRRSDIKTVYEIHLDGDVQEFRAALDTISDLFKTGKTVVSDYYVPGTCAVPATINDSWLTNNWINDDYLNLLDGYCAWTITQGNPNITVAVVDVDFDTEHEDLQNQITSVWGDNSTVCDHGTFVAGCVAAEANNGKGIAGIGYNTKIAGYAVDGTCHSSTQLWPAIWQAYQDGHRIINVSWTGIGTYPNVAAVQEITEGGTILVVAAGNDTLVSTGTLHSAYANIPGVIKVSGVTHNNEHGPTGHARSSTTDVCALSTNVSTTERGNNYSGVWGTSMAAPQVAGVAALILAVDDCLMPGEVEEIIKTTTDPIADAASYVGLIGTGKVNAYQAVLMAQDYGVYPTITASVTWSNDRYVKERLVIDNGATLTLTGSLRMADDARIEVKPGSKLIIDGGTITAAMGCKDDRWNGIYVSGNSTASQSNSPSLFGKVILKNGAKLENAQQAINNYGLTSSGSLDWDAIGGIVQADDAVFFNNVHGARFMAYTNKNSSGNPINDKSYFRKCTFSVDDDMINGDYLYAFIEQWKTRGVDIFGCKFTNNQTNTFEIDRGIGVFNQDALCRITDHCNSKTYPCPTASQVHNIFTGLRYGVNASGTGNGLAVTSIYNAEFTNNPWGIYSGSSDNLIVTGSTFNVNGTDGPMGIFLENSPITDIYLNEFNGVSGANVPAGIVAEDLGQTASPIYNNTFNDLVIGCSAQGGNKNGISGLEFLCNKYNNNNVAISVVDHLPHVGAQGIAAFQGSNGDGAGNWFENNGIDIWNSAQTEAIAYWHNTVTGPHPLIPDPTVGVVYLVDAGVTYAQDGCSLGKKGKSTLIASYQEANEELAAKQAALEAITDGGNTEAALHTVATAGVGEEMELRNQLLQISPNVSEEVLKATVEKTAALPHAMLRDVLAANPQAGKDKKVMDAVNMLPLPMEEYMVEQIAEAAHSISPKEKKASEVANALRKRERLAHQVVLELMHDTLHYNPKAAKHFLREKNDLFADLELMKIYAAEKNLQGMDEVAERMASRQLSETQAARLQGYTTFRNLEKALMVEGKNWQQADEQTIAQLWELSVEENIAGQYAQNILEFLGLADFENKLIVPVMQSQGKKAYAGSDGKTPGFVRVQPVPAQEYIVVKYDIRHLSDDVMFELLEATGKPMLSHSLQNTQDQTVIDLRGLKAGTYAYRVVSSGKMHYSGKVVVTE